VNNYSTTISEMNQKIDLPSNLWISTKHKLENLIYFGKLLVLLLLRSKDQLHTVK
jgi:hypothetical protein